MSVESRTPIDDIISDDEGRHILDSADKIVRWIQYQHEEQEIKYAQNPDIPFTPYINLSSCSISTHIHKGRQSLTNLCDIAGKVDCIIDTSKDYPNKTKYHQEVLEQVVCNNSIIYGAAFHHTKFHKDIIFYESTIIGGHCDHCEFMYNAFISDCKFNMVTFNHSIFHKDASFSNSFFNSLQVSFHDCEFYGSAHFSKLEFKDFQSDISLVNFSNCLFSREFLFQNIVLPSNCSFDSCIFEQSAQFRNIESAFTISFHNAVIKNTLYIVTIGENQQNKIQELQIPHIKISGRLDIENSIIGTLNANFTDLQNNGILRLFRNTISKCDMDSICNRGIIIFEEDNLSQIILDSAINIGIIELENTKIDAHNITSRKTARILKDSAYKSNNIIDGLKYRALELDIHKSEKNLPLCDWLILLLNKISNDYDRNFLLSFLFTLGFAGLFFWGINYFGVTTPIFELNSDFNFTGFGEIWKKYLDVLNVLNFREKLNGVELNAVGETLFLLAKIVVAYGMYQTIAAFRKYRKNP